MDIAKALVEAGTAVPDLDAVSALVCGQDLPVVFDVN
jgi:hypothetical protein